MPSPKSSLLINSAFITILFAGFVIIFFPVLKGLVMVWSGSEEYSHGFFIIPLSIFIIWQKKDTLRKVQYHPSWFGLPVVGFFLFVYIIARYAGILTLAPVAMIFVLFGIVIFLYGFAMLKELYFPLFFLFFMVPIPAQIFSALTIPLQLFVSKISVDITHLIGVPVFREGNVIHLPDQTLQVVRACSGLRSMISLLTLSAIFGYFTIRANILRGMLFVLGIPVAVIVNIVRVILMILAFYYFGYDLTQGKIHTIFGLLIFLLALILLVLIKGVLAIWDRPAKTG